MFLKPTSAFVCCFYCCCFFYDCLFIMKKQNNRKQLWIFFVDTIHIKTNRIFEITTKWFMRQGHSLFDEENKQKNIQQGSICEPMEHQSNCLIVLYTNPHNASNERQTWRDSKYIQKKKKPAYIFRSKHGSKIRINGMREFST